MKNRTLALTSGSTPYIKQLRNITGTVNAALLMQQLDYWFAKPQYTDGFYKFMSPCDHPAYKPEDSWVEEMNFSVDELNLAFSKIGTAYQSLKEYREAQASGDVFKGNFYASYRDRKTYMTRYIRNHEITDAAIDSVFKPAENSQNYCKRGLSVYRENDEISVNGDCPSTVIGESPSTLYIDTKNTLTEITKKEKIYKKEKDSTNCGMTQHREERSEKKTKIPKHTESMEAFWKLYPRKVGKIVAEKALKKSLKGTTLEEIIQGLEKAKAKWKESATEEQYIPYPASWLNAGQWLNEYPTGKKNPDSSEKSLANGNESVSNEEKFEEILNKSDPGLAKVYRELIQKYSHYCTVESFNRLFDDVTWEMKGDIAYFKTRDRHARYKINTQYTDILATLMKNYFPKIRVVKDAQ